MMAVFRSVAPREKNSNKRFKTCIYEMNMRECSDKVDKLEFSYMEDRKTEKFTLVIRGEGVNYKPLRYSILKSQVESWGDLLGDDDDPIVDFEQGSLKVIFTMALATFNALIQDIHTLRSGMTNLHLPSRQTWYNRMVKDAQNNGWEYRLFGGDEQILHLDRESSTQVRKKRRENVIRLTSVVQGKIINVGGKTPNIHVLLGARNITIGIDEDELQKENLVYKNKIIEVEYSYNIDTGEENDYKFKKFINKLPYDKDGMKELVKQETNAWANVTNITKWVREQRGDV